MNKRSVLTLSLFAMSLAACATVSVVPGSAVVETQLSEEQTELRKAAVSFGEAAVSRGWVAETRGFFDLARVLVDGQSKADVSADKSYATLIGVDVRSADDVAATLAADASDAALALSGVTRQANAFLQIQPEAREVTARADLVSFERVLVQAQQARRTFAETMETAQLADTDNVARALTRLDDEIDQAREIADALAVEYSGRTVPAAVS